MKDGANKLAALTLKKAEANGPALDLLNNMEIRIQNEINDKVKPMRTTERETYAYLEVMKKAHKFTIELYLKEVAKA